MTVIREELRSKLLAISGIDLDEELEVFRTSGYTDRYHSPSLLRLSRKKGHGKTVSELSEDLKSIWTRDDIQMSCSSNGFINLVFESSDEHPADKLDDSRFNEIEVPVIGFVESGTFTDKWGTPRQGQLAPESECVIRFSEPLAYSNRLFEPNSSCIVLWVPHLNRNSSCRAMVRPPKGGGRKVGVFATRAPHRPSPVCMSICIVLESDRSFLRLAQSDLTQDTPVLSVYKYEKKFHAFPALCPQWVSGASEIKVVWGLGAILGVESTTIVNLICDTLRQDPRSIHSQRSLPLHAIRVGGVQVTYNYQKDSSGEFLRILKVKKECKNSTGKLRTSYWLENQLKLMPFL